MNEIISLIIIALATYGVAYPVTALSGPADIFLRLRNKLPVLECAICLSLWVAALFVIVHHLGFAYYLTPLAVVGVVILLERI